MAGWIKEEFNFYELQRILFKLVENVPLFTGMTQAELAELLNHTEKCTFDPGAAIVREGTLGEFLYIIIDGEVSIMKHMKEGYDKEIAKLASGECFGEMGLVDKEPRWATVIALDPTVLLRIGEPGLLKNPAIGAKIYRNIARVLSQRYRHADELFSLW